MALRVILLRTVLESLFTPTVESDQLLLVVKKGELRKEPDFLRWHVARMKLQLKTDCQLHSNRK